MDRKAWIAIILSIAGLVGWQWHYVKTYGNRPAKKPANGISHPRSRNSGSRGSPATTATPNPTSLTAGPAQSAPSTPTVKPESASLYSQNAEYIFANDKGGIERAMLLLHGAENKTQVALNGSLTPPIGAIGRRRRARPGVGLP